MSGREPCPFCTLPSNRVLTQSEVAIAFYDAFPVTEGHTLIIPRKHVTSIYELSESEIAALWQFAGEVRKTLADELEPDGFNIGINDGFAAGQTVDHAHIHIIPRRRGDVVDPRGGIRWVIPDKVKYWSD